MTDQELKDLVASIAIAQKKTDEQLNKTDEQLRFYIEAQKKTDEQMKKTDEQMKKTDEKIKKLSHLYGGASNNQGKVAEEFFFNSLKHEPVLNGIRFNFIDKNITRTMGNLQEEYDILLVNGKIVYLIEVKYNLNPKDMEVFLDKKYPNFIKLYPEYSGFEIRLAFASFSIDELCISFAKEKKITLLQRRGKVFETLAA
jgi:hypothetical protein